MVMLKLSSILTLMHVNVVRAFNQNQRTRKIFSFMIFCGSRHKISRFSIVPEGPNFLEDKNKIF